MTNSSLWRVTGVTDTETRFLRARTSGPVPSPLHTARGLESQRRGRGAARATAACTRSFMHPPPQRALLLLEVMELAAAAPGALRSQTPRGGEEDIWTRGRGRFLSLLLLLHKLCSLLLHHGRAMMVPWLLRHSQDHPPDVLSITSWRLLMRSPPRRRRQWRRRCPWQRRRQLRLRRLRWRHFVAMTAVAPCGLVPLQRFVAVCTLRRQRWYVCMQGRWRCRRSSARGGRRLVAEL